MFHKLSPLGQQHFVHNWSVANAAARTALAVVAADIGKICYQVDTTDFWILRNNVGPVWANITLAAAPVQAICIPVALSDETSAITTGVKLVMHIPFAFKLLSVAMGLTTVQASGSLFRLDVTRNGATIFTTKVTIDNTEKTSNTAATPSVLTSTPINVAAFDEFAFNIDQIGNGSARGAKAYLVGTL